MSTLAPLFAEYYDLAAQMNNCSIFDCVLPAEVGSGVLYADTQQLIAGSMTPEDMQLTARRHWKRIIKKNR